MSDWNPMQRGARDSMAEKQVQLRFVRERETKTTIRFAEVDPRDDPKVGTLYVKKALLHDLGDPEELTVTIAATR
jgi:hypothetical protein